MKYLIKNIEVKDSLSSWNTKLVDILWSKGKILQIDASLNSSDSGCQIIDGAGKYITPAWIDLRTNIQEPGNEHKESLLETAWCGLSGGFGTLVTMPETQPVVQTKDTLTYILNKSEKLPLNLLPMAALTKNFEGKELNELIDLHHYGAVGFTDASESIFHSGLLIRALQYVQHTGAFIMQHPEDINITSHGQMHEGEVSTYVGLKGLPALAENLIILRDLELLKYSGGRIHFSRISSRASVEIIKKAKQSNLPVTCDVSVAHLLFTDQALLELDSNFKLNPPLRTEDDRLALWQGLQDGTIDVIVTDHLAQDIESKELEFDYASNGMIMLETAFAMLNELKPNEHFTNIIHQAFTSNPAQILGIKNYAIEIGNECLMTIWDEHKIWKYLPENKKTSAKNSPLLGKTMKGKAVGIFCKDTYNMLP